MALYKRHADDQSLSTALRSPVHEVFAAPGRNVARSVIVMTEVL